MSDFTLTPGSGAQFNCLQVTVHYASLKNVPADPNVNLVINGDNTISRADGQPGNLYPTHHVFEAPDNQPSLFNKIAFCYHIRERINHATRGKQVKLNHVNLERSEDDRIHCTILFVAKQTDKRSLNQWKRMMGFAIGNLDVHIEKVAHATRAFIYQLKGNGTDDAPAYNPEAWDRCDPKDMVSITNCIKNDVGYGFNACFAFTYLDKDDKVNDWAGGFRSYIAPDGGFEAAEQFMSESFGPMAGNIDEILEIFDERLFINRGAVQQAVTARENSRTKKAKFSQAGIYDAICERAHQENLPEQVDSSDMLTQLTRIGYQLRMGMVQEQTLQAAYRDITVQHQMNMILNGNKFAETGRLTAKGAIGFTCNKVTAEIENFLHKQDEVFKEFGSALLYNEQLTGPSGSGKTAMAKSALRKMGILPATIKPGAKFLGCWSEYLCLLIDDMAPKGLRENYQWFLTLMEMSLHTEEEKYVSIPRKMSARIFLWTCTIPAQVLTVTSFNQTLADSVYQLNRRIAKWNHVVVNDDNTRSLVDLSGANGFKILVEDGRQVLELSDHMMEHVPAADMESWGFDLETKRLKVSANAPNFRGI